MARRTRGNPTADEWPLIERDQHVRRIVEVLSERGRPVSMVITGPAGVGRTRLLAETVRVAQSRGIVTRWVSATRSASTVPFGAFAHLLPEELGASRPAQSGSPNGLSWYIRRSLGEHGGGRRLVIFIDDAHLLDAASAALVHHLVVTSAAVIVATVRSGEPVPDAITVLWKEGLAGRLPLQPLGRPAVAELLERTLGGQLEADTTYRLWHLSGGNLVFLRELVGEAQSNGRLAQTHGVWRVTGRLRTSAELDELIMSDLEAVRPPLRSVVEVVSFAEPVGVSMLEYVGVTRAALEDSEREGLITVVEDPRRMTVRLGQPLYGFVVRATTPPLRADHIRRQLADGLERTGARRWEDSLCLAILRLDSRTGPNAELLLDAGQRAGAYFDYALMERLGRAAERAGAGFPARSLIAESRARQGASEEGEARYAELERTATTLQERANAGYDRAVNLAFGLGRVEQAEQVIGEAEALAASSKEWRRRLSVLRAAIALHRGHTAVALGADCWRDAGSAGGDASDLGGHAAVTMLVWSGRIDQAIAIGERALLTAEATPGPVPGHWSELTSWALGLAYVFSGQLEPASRLVAIHYQRTLAWGAAELRAHWAFLHGRIASMRGQLHTADRSLREAAVLFRERPAFAGPVALLRCMGELAMTTAQQGAVSTAASILEEADAVPANGLFVSELELGRAWAAAGTGDLRKARALALRTADACAALGSCTLELRALHDAARLGERGLSSARVRDLGRQVQGRLPAAMVAHAEALLLKDGDGLDLAAQTFGQLGMAAVASEAARSAATVHARAGRRAAAAASRANAQSLASACERVLHSFDGVQGVGTPDELLTQRQLVIATLAAEGRRNRDIAEQLGISIRTVENHLQGAYAKLFVTSRRQLAQIFVSSNGGKERRS